MSEHLVSATEKDSAVPPDVRTLERLLTERHSCRGFLPDELDRGMIESIFTLAQRTASWCNSQPWQVSILSGAATRRVRDALLDPPSGSVRQSDIPFPTEYKGVYLDRRRECGFQLYNAVGVPRGDTEGYRRQTEQNFRFFGAPHVAIITTEPPLGTYGAVDVGGYVQVLLLAMQAHGIGAIPQAALANFSPLLKSLLGIPVDRHVVCGVSFGYKDPSYAANSFRTSRAALPDVVTWVDQ
jgi:nitroreductase